MILKRFYEERLAQASFLLGCSASGEAIVIDPNRAVERYINAASAEGMRITSVTETHIHADFVSGSRELARRTGATLCVSAEGGSDWQYDFAKESGVRQLRDGDSIRAGRIRLEVQHTPGHTPEHLAFVLTDEAASPEPVGAFTGDFIFAGDVGRPDLLERAAGIAGTMEAGARQLFTSLRKFKSMPERLLLWPGHGSGSACGKNLGGMPVTTLGYEKLASWAFFAKDEAEFVQAVLEDQPDPPRYFAEMKRVNKAGAGAALAKPVHLAPDTLEVAVTAGAKTQVIDLRPAAEFASAFIPGTITIPLDKNFLKWVGALLDHKKPTYLIGLDEAQAARAAAALALIGVDKISGWYDPGALDLWRGRHGKLAAIEQLQASQWQQQPKHLVLDVRTAMEFRAGHIPGALHIPLGHLPEALGKLSFSPDSAVIVHCQAGARSAVALSFLVKMGFRNLINLSGGFADYQRLGLPVETGGA
jgi:hydroxyacylglutathione hydrolase